MLVYYQNLLRLNTRRTPIRVKTTNSIITTQLITMLDGLLQKPIYFQSKPVNFSFANAGLQEVSCLFIPKRIHFDLSNTRSHSQ